MTMVVLVKHERVQRHVKVAADEPDTIRQRGHNGVSLWSLPSFPAVQYVAHRKDKPLHSEFLIALSLAPRESFSRMEGLILGFGFCPFKRAISSLSS